MNPAPAALPRLALDIDINKPTGHSALVYSHNRVQVSSCGECGGWRASCAECSGLACELWAVWGLACELCGVWGLACELWAVWGLACDLWGVQGMYHIPTSHLSLSLSPHHHIIT